MKLEPPKRGSQKKHLRRSFLKKTPPPGPLINSCLWSPQKIRGKIAFSDFRVFVFWPIFLFFLFLGLFAVKKLSSKFFPVFRGVQKQGKTGFFLLVSWQFILGDGVFPCGGLMLVLLYIYLLCYKCGICPCSVTCSFCFSLCFLFVLFLFGRQVWGWVTDFLTLVTSVVLHH